MSGRSADFYLAQAPYRGASLLIEVADSYLFGVKRLKREPHTWGITGIGGKVEEEESFVDCARREAQEEIGCSVEILPSSVGYYVDLQGRCHPTQFADQAFAAVLRYAAAPPFQPWQGLTPFVLGVAMFRARLKGRAMPIEKLPLLLLIPKSQALDLVGRHLLYAELTEICTEMRKQPNFSVDSADRFRFVDSPEALFLALKTAAPQNRSGGEIASGLA